ncbi:polysaccharide deacetylase [Clostridiales bacterium oral taxon 876 str. F0540]|nr:polysaccharide deacetylase [Clostridiales bacterium oral taxon 876 str. F0540]
MKSRKKRRRGLKALMIILAVVISAATLYLKLDIARATAKVDNIQKYDNNVQASAESNADKNAEDKKNLQPEEKTKQEVPIKQTESSETKSIVVTTTKNSDTNKTASSANNSSKGDKIAYLTFDDGPSYKVTPAVLDILKKENIKATFFVVGQTVKSNPELLKREKAEGHTIGNHTYSHNYKYLYSNTSNFLEDLKKNDSIIKSVIGDYNDKLIRFPGGSFGKQAYQKAAEEAGYTYIDWNCLSGDAESKKKSVEQLIQGVKSTARGQHQLTILMHDTAGKETTAEALPKIIEYLKGQGYKFEVLK